MPFNKELLEILDLLNTYSGYKYHLKGRRDNRVSLVRIKNPLAEDYIKISTETKYLLRWIKKSSNIEYIQTSNSDEELLSWVKKNLSVKLR